MKPLRIDRQKWNYDPKSQQVDEDREKEHEQGRAARLIHRRPFNSFYTWH
jgi:hypothetical protein